MSTHLTHEETRLFETRIPTAAMVVAACLAVDDVEHDERYTRVGRIASYLRHTESAPFAKAVVGFQSFGPDAVVFKRLQDEAARPGPMWACDVCGDEHPTADLVEYAPAAGDEPTATMAVCEACECTVRDHGCQQVTR